MDGYLRALDADTGEVVWQTRLPAIVSGGAATYSVNGRQYIAIAIGGAQRNGLNNYRAMVPDVDMAGRGHAVFVFAPPPSRRKLVSPPPPAQPHPPRHP